jgi:hypothetical protein
LVENYKGYKWESMKLKRMIKSAALIATLGFFGFSCFFSSSDLTLERANQNDTKASNSESSLVFPSDGVELTTADDSFTAKITKSNYTDDCQSFAISFIDNGDTDYILGYYGENSLNLPLACQYEVTHSDNTKETKICSFNLSSTNSIYDSVGGGIGSSSASLYVDIPKEKTDSIARDSFTLFNIFKAYYDDTEKTYLPDTTTNYIISTFGATSAGRKNINLSEYLTTKLDKIASFGNYISFNTTISNNFSELYKTYNSTDYESELEGLEAGTVVFKSTFPSLVNSKFELTYSDGSVVETEVKPSSSTSLSSVFVIKNGSNSYRFLIKGVSTKNLVSFRLLSTNISIGLLDIAKNKIISGTSFALRAGIIDFSTYNYIAISSVSHLNFTLVSILVVAIFTILFASTSVGLYFYKKRKYKNDEFKRVNAKRFAKTSVSAYFASLVVFVDILFIASRATFFNNSVTCLNPLDNFIVVLSIVGIIFIGYWIKALVSYLKDIKEKKASDLMNKNNKEDDGTKLIGE